MLSPRLKEPFTTEFKRLDAYLLCNDTGAGIFDLANARHINVGISEMVMCGMAAGMAKSGLKVFTAAIACHYIRAWELIRTLIVPWNLDVGFVGTGIDEDYSSLGHSHMSTEREMRTLCDAVGVEYVIPKGADHLVEIMRQTNPRFMHFSRNMHL